MYYFSFLVQNLPADRKWPEVNQCVVYPIKETLVRMENGSLINMYDPVVQFCVSFITLNVAEVGLKRVIGSWNSHSINGVYGILVGCEEHDVLAELAVVVLTPGARFSEVPKLFGRISGDIVFFVSMKRPASKNKRVGGVSNVFSGLKKFRDFRETGPSS